MTDAKNQDQLRNPMLCIQAWATFTFFTFLRSELDRQRGREGGRGAFTGWTRRCSRPMTGPHRRLRTIDIAGGVAPKMAGGGHGEQHQGSTTAIRPPEDGPGNHQGIAASPVGRHWTIGQRRGRDGHVKW